MRIRSFVWDSVCVYDSVFGFMKFFYGLDCSLVRVLVVMLI